MVRSDRLEFIGMMVVSGISTRHCMPAPLSVISKEFAMQLYNVLTKYIRATYSYKKKAAAWLSPEFLEKYRTHYFFALRAGQPVNDYE